MANGSKIERPNEKINYSLHSGNYWKYTAFISLEKEEVELLKNNEIEIIRLYIYDTDLSIPGPSAKGAKTITKYNTKIRTYIKESLSCILLNK